ncbi:MAG: collagen-like protein [Deltaproteobacteria bacterium]|nr:collagen-like protein [Deltaproteobacteria bacterium]
MMRPMSFSGVLLRPAMLALSLAGACEGRQGPEGRSGVPGSTGPYGPEGQQGTMGNMGAQGYQGIPGPVGPQGPAGSCFYPDGGSICPAGPQGPMGATGPQGLMGSPGPAGLQGPAGIPGPVGPQGFMGPAGPRGLAGPAGILDPTRCTPRFSRNLNISSPTNAGGVLYCNSNEFLLTGGCAVSTASGRAYNYFDSRPTDPNTDGFLLNFSTIVGGGWVCYFDTNTGVSTENYSIYIWAVCCR